MARVVQGTAARRDFIVHYAYLLENGGLDLAKRFRDAVQHSYGRLSQMPQIGAPGRVLSGKYTGVRIWPVHGFENYLIAYKLRSPETVVVLRVVHAKQDYIRVLGPQ
jgi:plasmid stabilization system protein ParE